MPTAVVFWIVLIALAAVLMAAGLRASKKRTEALRRASASAGFTFEARSDLTRLKALGDLPLYSFGHSYLVSNVLTGTHAGRDVRMFDIRYRMGTGKRSTGVEHTVALFPGAGRALPDFVMTAENPLFRWAWEQLGHPDFDFPSSPEFSARYLLRGPDETAVRAAFTPEVLSGLAMRQGWTVEAQGGAVAIYRFNRLVKPGEVQAFLEDSASVLQVLTPRPR